MGEHADDAIHAGLDSSWGWRRPRRAYVGRISAEPSPVSDFADLAEQPVDPTPDTLIDAFERAASEYEEYACTETGSAYDEARKALLARMT